MPRYIQVEYPSGNVENIDMLRLLVLTQNAEMQAKFGMSLARNAPTLKAIREEFEIPATVCRTWKQAARLLRAFHTDLTEAINAAS